MDCPRLVVNEVRCLHQRSALFLGVNMQMYPRLVTLIAGTLLAGCSDTSAGTSGSAEVSEAIVLPDCSALRENAVAMYAGKDLTLLKIYDPKETSKSAKEVRCSGRGMWSDSSEDALHYRAYIDEDGQSFTEVSLKPFENIDETKASTP